MKQETFDKYEKILKRKIELMKGGMKLIQIKSVLADEFCLSESMINEILYARRRKLKMDNYIQSKL